jgi:hypothetical protein
MMKVMLPQANNCLLHRLYLVMVIDSSALVTDIVRTITARQMSLKNGASIIVAAATCRWPKSAACSKLM